jgi:hypothetical protein
VTDGGGLQERLASAAIGLNSIPSENGLPKKYQEVLESIKQELTKEHASRDEGRILATICKMSNQEARKVAEQILNLYTDLRGGI